MRRKKNGREKILREIVRLVDCVLGLVVVDVVDGSERRMLSHNLRSSKLFLSGRVLMCLLSLPIAQSKNIQ